MIWNLRSLRASVPSGPSRVPQTNSLTAIGRRCVARLGLHPHEEVPLTCTHVFFSMKPGARSLRGLFITWLFLITAFPSCLASLKFSPHSSTTSLPTTAPPRAPTTSSTQTAMPTTVRFSQQSHKDGSGKSKIDSWLSCHSSVQSNPTQFSVNTHGHSHSINAKCKGKEHSSDSTDTTPSGHGYTYGYDQSFTSVHHTGARFFRAPSRPSRVLVSFITLTLTQVQTSSYPPSPTPLHLSPLRNPHLTLFPSLSSRLPSHTNNTQTFSLPPQMPSDFERSSALSHARSPLLTRYPPTTLYPTLLKLAHTTAIRPSPLPSQEPPPTWTKNTKNANV